MRGCHRVWRGQTGSQLLAATPVGLRLEQLAAHPLAFILLGNEACQSPGTWDGSLREHSPGLRAAQLLAGGIQTSHLGHQLALLMSHGTSCHRSPEETQVETAEWKEIWSVHAEFGSPILVSVTHL